MSKPIWGLHWQGYDIPSIAVLLGIPEDKVVDSLKEKARVRIRKALEQHDVQAYVDARNWLWRLMG